MGIQQRVCAGQVVSYFKRHSGDKWGSMITACEDTILGGMNCRCMITACDDVVLKAGTTLPPTAAGTPGCCFSYGYGAMMAPCCLQTKEVADVASCEVEQRHGGAYGYSKGECPASAEEAADIVASSKDSRYKSKKPEGKGEKRKKCKGPKCKDKKKE